MAVHAVSGVRSARKHIGWCVKSLPGGNEFRAAMNQLDEAAAQLAAVHDFFEALGERADRIISNRASATQTVLPRDSTVTKQGTSEGQEQTA